jgi:hypothetical protein
MLAAALFVPATAAADDIKYFLNNTGLDADAMGKARYREKNGEQRFEVQLSSMTPGSYEATVADISVGTFTVGEEGDGKLRLRAADLGFDPRGQSVKVQAEGDAGSVFFASAFPTTQDEADLNIKVRESFVNEEGVPGVKADAKYSARNGKAKLDVKVRKLPVGTYELYVGGNLAGSVVVVADEDGETAGIAKYDSRFNRGDREILLFNPYCQSLAVSQTVDLVTTDLLTIAAFGDGCL